MGHSIAFVILPNKRGSRKSKAALTKSFIEACKSDNAAIIVVDKLNVWINGYP